MRLGLDPMRGHWFGISFILSGVYALPINYTLHTLPTAHVHIILMVKLWLFYIQLMHTGHVFSKRSLVTYVFKTGKMCSLVPRLSPFTYDHVHIIIFTYDLKGHRVKVLCVHDCTHGEGAWGTRLAKLLTLTKWPWMHEPTILWNDIFRSLRSPKDADCSDIFTIFFMRCLTRSMEKQAILILQQRGT